MVARKESFKEGPKVNSLAWSKRACSVPESLLLNRELSLLEFHRRVLEEARDESNPLLERLKFLSIFASNIDEFFMTRVSALKEELEENITELSPDGLTPVAQLELIRNTLLAMSSAQTDCLHLEILPELKSAGIEIASYDSLTQLERHVLDSYFAEKVFPVLTPLAVDPSHPFPYISPSSLNLGLMVETPGEPDTAHTQSETRFVRIKVPSLVPRLIPVGGAKSKFVLAEDLIIANVRFLFPGANPGQCYTFRVTRDADIDIREEEADDLLRVMQQELRKRRFGAPVRLEVSSAMPQCYAAGTSLFDAIKEGDILLHHPFDSYSSVTDFVEASVKDPDVVAIKICLYRTGPDSPIPPALIQACEQGKQVTALIELKARFDEAHNIEWAQRLDEAGVHVVYGLLGLKTHGKLTLIVRREGDSLKRYVHIASGNYNPTTSCTYTDIGLLTANEEIGAAASEFFNYLTGCSRQKNYRQLLVAPVNMRERLSGLIDREIEHQKAGDRKSVV